MSLEPVESGRHTANTAHEHGVNDLKSQVVTDGIEDPILVADIGGTNARFGWVAERGATPGLVSTLPVSQFANPEAAAIHYLAGVATQLGTAYRAPRRAAFAVATAVLGDEVQWTNSPWGFAQTKLRETLGLDQLHVLNDFEALASSLPHLSGKQLAWRGHAPRAHTSGQMLAVVGPGTGLGVAAIKHVPAAGWIALPGEGGHATLSTQGAAQVQVLAYIHTLHAHVSAERLLCGNGLSLLHQAVCAVNGMPIEHIGPHQVLGKALSDAAGLHSQTLELFCQFLGGFAGNVALTCGARGGLFIGGGIVPRMGERFFASGFRAAFEAKGRFSSYLAEIPTPVIVDTLAALTGAAAVADQPSP